MSSPVGVGGAKLRLEDVRVDFDVIIIRFKVAGHIYLRGRVFHSYHQKVAWFIYQ